MTGTREPVLPADLLEFPVEQLRLLRPYPEGCHDATIAYYTREADAFPSGLLSYNRFFPRGGPCRPCRGRLRDTEKRSYDYQQHDPVPGTIRADRFRPDGCDHNNAPDVSLNCDGGRCPCPWGPDADRQVSWTFSRYAAPAPASPFAPKAADPEGAIAGYCSMYPADPVCNGVTAGRLDAYYLWATTFTLP